MSKYRHKEAFALMHYGCDCGHQEVIWNERDGVTPFTVPCPSCGDSMGLSHFAFQSDRCAPDHKPHFGQRVFCAMTRERAESIVDDRMRKRPLTPPRYRQPMINDLYRDGEAPDIRIEGYGSGR